MKDALKLVILFVLGCSIGLTGLLIFGLWSLIATVPVSAVAGVVVGAWLDENL